MARKSQRPRKASSTPEQTYGLDEFLKKAEDDKSPWPQLSDDNVNFTSDSRPGRRSGLQEELAKVVTWTMVGVVGAVTIFAIATGNENLLKILLAIAAPLLIRLALKGVGNVKLKKSERNHYSDDS